MCAAADPPGTANSCWLRSLRTASISAYRAWRKHAPGVSASAISRIATRHIREETYSKALAEIVNYHHSLKFAGHWGDGTTSSSDGQRFPTGGRGDVHGQHNARYGRDPGVNFYTHSSDQYAPFHSKLISTTVRDATYVLDGLLYHESNLRIVEHYTDTAGFTDHVSP